MSADSDMADDESDDEDEDEENSKNAENDDDQEDSKDQQSQVEVKLMQDVGKCDGGCFENAWVRDQQAKIDVDRADFRRRELKSAEFYRANLMKH